MPGGHRVPDGLEAGAFSIAAENPDDVGLVTIPLTFLRRFLHNPVHVREIGLVGLPGVIVLERTIPVGIWHGEAVELGENDGLDDGEALRATQLEIALRVFASEPMEELPRRIAEIEKRRAVTVFEKAAVPRDLERSVRKVDGRAR